MLPAPKRMWGLGDGPPAPGRVGPLFPLVLKTWVSCVYLLANFNVLIECADYDSHSNEIMGS